MSEFYSGMPGPAAIDKLNNLWNLAGGVGAAVIDIGAAMAAAEASAAAAAGSATTASTQATDANNSATVAASSAAASSIAATNASNQATLAAGSATTASTHATNASNQATAAASSATTASTAATDAGNQATAAASSATTASTAATNASNQATAAASSATTASTAATNASNSATAAASSATAASTAATNAAAEASAALTSASAAQISESQAATSATSALEYKNLAQDWAEKTTEVEPGKYSAKYWAGQAAASVTGQLVYRGAWSAAGGAYPTTPVLGDYYKISVAGTISGTVFDVNDSILYNGTAWDKIDNTEEAGLVTSVAGKVGAVTLAKEDVGLSNVDNTSDVNKPISTAQQAALNAKEGAITAGTTSQYWRGDKQWQTLDKTVVGLSNVDNTSDVNKPVSTAQQAALNAKEGAITAGTTSQYWRGDKQWQTLDKTAVGLSNVDNTSDVNKPVSTAQQAALNDKLNLSGGTLTGNLLTLQHQTTKATLLANDINLNTGNFFTKTVSTNTTFTVSNTPATGTTASFILELTNGGVGTITWWSGVKWAGGIAPTLTVSGVDILGFYTHDGGTTWRGLVLAKDSK